MTGMLASVSSIAEAEIVLDTGVDIVDIKNPHEGALGALDTRTVKEIVRSVDGRMPTSATIGDINSDDPNLLKLIVNMADTGVDIVKVGLFEKEPSEYFVSVISEAANNKINLVVVLFAENYAGNVVMTPLMQSGIVGIMLDTKEKIGKNLRSLLNDTELQQFVDIAREFKLLTGLAGSLRFVDIEPLLELNPDYLGFRGALCSEYDRIGTINSEQVEKIRNQIPVSEYINYDNRVYREASISR